MRHTAQLLAILAIMLHPILWAGEQWFYPVNRNYFELNTDTGSKVMFQRGMFGNSRLYGENGWEGKFEGRRVELHSPSGATVRLENCPDISSGGVSAKKKPEPLSSFYISEADINKAIEDAEKQDIWKTDSRLRLFSKNPNVDAVFWGTLVVIFLAVLLEARSKPIRLISAVLLAISMVLVFLTKSRGAVVAIMGGGAIVLLLQLHNHITLKRVMIIAFTALSLGVVVWLCPWGARYSRNLFAADDSNSLRMEILREFPAMVADSPEGVGKGNSGASYLVWYRSEDKLRMTRTLISSHLTYYLEYGNLARIAYLFCWLAGLLVLGIYAWRGGWTIPAGVWSVLFLSGCFNPVLECGWLWAIPILSLVSMIMRPPKIGRKILPASIALSLIVSIGLLMWIVDTGNDDERFPSIRVSSKNVCVNGTEPSVWIAGDHQVLGGVWTFVGDEILSYYENNPECKVAIGYVESLDNLPKSVDRLVLSGKQAERYLERWNNPKQRESLCRPNSLLLISPSVEAGLFPTEIASSGHIRAVVGQIAAQRSGTYSEKLQPWIRLVRGSFLYIPDWVRLCTNF